MADLESQFLNLQKKYLDFKYEKAYKEDGVTAELIHGDKYNDQEKNYLYVQEQDILIQDIQHLCVYFENVFLNLQKPIEFPFEFIKYRAIYVIQKYQEQANLLDALLPHIVPPLMDQVKKFLHAYQQNQQNEQNEQSQQNEKKSNIPAEFHHMIQILYTLCKTRNYKAIVEFFPHEVKDLEPCIFYLQHQNKDQQVNWVTNYVLLLWLSIIILVPFDLKTIDSSGTMFKDLMTISQTFLNSSSITRDAAAIFLSKYFQRPDIQKEKSLQNYLEWALQKTQEESDDPLFQCFLSGIYKSLVEILKAGQREELLQYVGILMQFIKSSNKDLNHDRLYKVKMACRIGMIYLKPRQTQWAYRKQIKQLNQNVSTTQKSSKLQTNCDHKENSEKSTEKNAKNQSKQDKINYQDDLSYFSDINLTDLEDIIEFLLQNLSDKDTNVRWASAKALGRITQNLALDMADDIVESLFQILNFDINEANWHGGMLTLAELSRRGLLLPNRLDQTMNFLYKALIYDENKGNYNAGSNVRDSACYVAWAFARAYDAEVMKPFQDSLAKQLLIVSLYDREINCRRAASAAFQEHVGRQGNFKHGIDILTEADYFTVGVALNAYINVGLYVSSFDVYFEYFVDHLAFNRLKHQDVNLRTRAAAALGVMCPLNPQCFVGVLEKLIVQSSDEMVNTRHGTFFAIADILLGLAGRVEEHNQSKMMGKSVFLRYLSKNEKKLVQAGEYRQKFNEHYDRLKKKNHLSLLNQDLLNRLVLLVKQIRDKRWLRGKSGEMMYIALNRLIECYASLNLPITDEAQKKLWLDHIDESLVHLREDIQTSAKQTYHRFSWAYQTEHTTVEEAYVKKMLKQLDLQTNTEIIARGRTQAFGVIHKSLKSKYFTEIMNQFDLNTNLKQKRNDPDTRKFTVQSIQAFFEDLDLKSLDTKQIQTMLDILFKCIKDYTLDNRGDIGSIVRDQVMLTIVRIAHELHVQRPDFLNESLIQAWIKLLLQQLVEKIDRCRLVAGSCLQELYNQTLCHYEFKHKEEIKAIFETSNINRLIEEVQQKFDKDFQVPTVQGLINMVAMDQKVHQDQIYPWNMPNCVFPTIIKLLDIPDYANKLLRGWVVSAGGLSNNVSKQAILDLTQYLKQSSTEKKVFLFSKLQFVFEENVKTDRILSPLIRTLDFILDTMDFCEDQEALSPFFTFFSQELLKIAKKTKIVQKMGSCLNVLVGLITYLDDKKERIKVVVEFLSHEFPKIRQGVAEKLQMALMSYGEEVFGEDKNEEICDKLLETDWLEMDNKFLPEIKEEWEAIMNEEEE